MKISKKRAVAAPLAVLALAGSSFLASVSFAEEPATATSKTISATEIRPLLMSGCELGYACIWSGKNYKGEWAADYANTGPFDIGSTWARAHHNSAAANGNACKATRFWNGSHTKYFVLSSETGGTGQSRDPYLTNGAGWTGWTNENWENNARSAQFVNCV